MLRTMVVSALTFSDSYYLLSLHHRASFHIHNSTSCPKGFKTGSLNRGKDIQCIWSSSSAIQLSKYSFLPGEPGESAINLVT